MSYNPTNTKFVLRGLFDRNDVMKKRAFTFPDKGRGKKINKLNTIVSVGTLLLHFCGNLAMHITEKRDIRQFMVD